MKHRLILFLLSLILAGCAHADDLSKNHVELFEVKSNIVILSIQHREWSGLFGPHGFGGFENVGYWATLEGAGPKFTNPKFDDNPHGIHCVGTIVLDREHNRVTIDMQRIILSESGKTNQIKSHPANGTYRITSVKTREPEK
jgi:hypothetical protein